MTPLTVLPTTPFHYQDALALGVTRQQLRTALEQGTLIRLRRGWYAVTSLALPEGERFELVTQDHLIRLRQALVDHPGCAASHSSGAVVHDLPLMIAAAAPIELTAIEDAPRSRSLPGVLIHHTDSMPTPTTTIDGIRTTTLPRTAADVLRTRRLPHGLAMADVAVREGTLEARGVREVLDQQRRWRGRPKALRVLELLDARRESWAESFSAGVIELAEMPQPIPQVLLYDENFTFVARLDGLLDHEQVAAETDGQAKYRIGATTESAEEIARTRLLAEGDRQRRIERLGLGVARWMTEEAMHDPDVVSGRINAAGARVAGQEFTGWVKWEGEFRKLPLLPR